jgi:hypothetical protein
MGGGWSLSRGPGCAGRLVLGHKSAMVRSSRIPHRKATGPFRTIAVYARARRCDRKDVAELRSAAPRHGRSRRGRIREPDQGRLLAPSTLARRASLASFCARSRSLLPGGLTALAARKDAGTARKDAGTARKDAGTARKDAGTARKDAGTARKDAGTARKDAGAVKLLTQMKGG